MTDREAALIGYQETSEIEAMALENYQRAEACLAKAREAKRLALLMMRNTEWEETKDNKGRVFGIRRRPTEGDTDEEPQTA